MAASDLLVSRNLILLDTFNRFPECMICDSATLASMPHAHNMYIAGKQGGRTRMAPLSLIVDTIRTIETKRLSGFSNRKDRDQWPSRS
jgi:hypothetical protein